MGSKFTVLATPFFFPGKTICCGTSQGPVVDFGAVGEFDGRDGAIYFCVNCLVEAALQTNEVVKPNSQVSISASDLRKISDYNERLHTLLNDGLGVLSSVGGVLSDLDSLQGDSEAAGDSSVSSEEPTLPTFDFLEPTVSKGSASVPADSSDDKSVGVFTL